MSESRFWIEELAPVSRPRQRPSGCDLCQHCTLLKVFARERAECKAPEDATDDGA